MAKALPKLACALLAFAMLGQKTTAQSLFAKAKEDSNKSLEVYVATLRDYFSRWSSLMLAEPVKGEDGQPEIHVNPAQRRLDFTMKISVNEDAYSAWKSEAFRRLAEAGISEAGGDGILIGGKTWAFPNNQGITQWINNDYIDMPKMTFRAMLVDAQGAEVRRLEFHENDVRKREIVKTEYEAMLRSWTEVKTNSVSTLPLYWFGRMKDYQSFESTNWLNKKQDGDSCFVRVGFEKLTDDEMERAASVKCVVLSPSDIENEQIDKEKAFWREQSDEDASHAVLSLISDLIQVPHKQYALGSHTVSQSQWEAIMDNNPVEDVSKRGGDKPMLGAEYKSIAQFIARINAHSSLCASGIRFRVPTVEEWQTAALAGKSGKFASFISRYGAKRDLAAGANEWGFNDILAGCWERVARQDREAGWVDDGWYACAGGTMDGTLVELLSLPIRYRDLENPYVERHAVGLRLCADWTPELQAAIAKAKDGLSSTAEEASPDDIVKNIIQEMINIPGTNILIGKYELTQAQWEAVMSGNPSKHQGKQFPVETLSKDQVFEFISKLNGKPAVVNSGLKFRLPTEKEWRKAALAGGLSDGERRQKYADGEISYEEYNTLHEKLIANGNLKTAYGLLADGTEANPSDVAWHGGYEAQFPGETSIDSTANGMPHKVGLKKPNAFGFFDMCGNVAEIVIHKEPYSADSYVAIGGNFKTKPQHCSVDDTDKYVWELETVGLRLCAVDVRQENKRREEAHLNTLRGILPNMVQVPVGKKSSIALGAHEVTQAEWVLFMTNNPSHFIGDNLPVETVDWDSVQVFLSRLNAHPQFAENGIVFRLPTFKEWKVAYKQSGEENAGRKESGQTSEVKQSGALSGLAGNVSEWVSSREFCGGNFEDKFRDPLSRFAFNNPDGKSKAVGLRLCADWTPELESAIAKAKQEAENALKKPDGE